MKCLYTGLCLALALAGGLAPAQERIKFDNAKEGEQSTGYKFWVGIIGGTDGVAAIRLDQIVSVSIHRYTVDGVAFKEVTVDTVGNNSIRFYACLNERVSTAKERMSNTRQLVDQHTGGASRIPAKKFPEGAYSHNIEYLVDNASDLNKIYESLVNAMIKGKGCTFRIK